MQSLQNIKKDFDSEFKSFKLKARSKQEELRPKDEIINQTLALLGNITNAELQSKNDIVNKLIDASIASNQNSSKTDVNILEHDKKNMKKKNNNEQDDIERSNNANKDHVTNAKINYSPKKAKSNNENVHKIY